MTSFMAINTVIKNLIYFASHIRFSEKKYAWVISCRAVMHANIKNCAWFLYILFFGRRNTKDNILSTLTFIFCRIPMT